MRRCSSSAKEEKSFGSEDLALDDRKVDLNLVEPTGMDGSVNEDGVRPLGAEAVDGLLPPMRGAVVHDPEHVAGRLVGFLAHDITHEARDGRNAVLRFTTSEDLGAVHIPSGPSRPRHPRENIPFQPWWDDAERDAKSAVSGDEPECWMGPALSANFGSRGKIQLRCCQGRRASLLSQRHNVAP